MLGAPANAGDRDPGSSRSHPTARSEQRGGVDQPALADGEVAGDMVTTSAFLTSRRT
jgi:hypothetical protein